MFSACTGIVRIPFISSGRDMIQRLEQAQINSVEFVWSLLNFSKAFLSSFNSWFPLLFVIPMLYVCKARGNCVCWFVKALEVLDKKILGVLKNIKHNDDNDNIIII